MKTITFVQPRGERMEVRSPMTETDSKSALQLVLVDDDEVDVLALRRAFRAQGITNEIHLASDGLAALDLLRSSPGNIRKPYVILLDLNMPRMTGIEFLRELRRDPELRESVVFVFSTSDDRRDIGDAYDLNVAGYVVKSRVEAGLNSLTNLLQRYWQVVDLPK